METGRAIRGMTPMEIELAFLMLIFILSVKNGMRTAPPPKPERAAKTPVMAPAVK